MNVKERCDVTNDQMFQTLYPIVEIKIEPIEELEEPVPSTSQHDVIIPLTDEEDWCEIVKNEELDSDSNDEIEDKELSEESNDDDNRAANQTDNGENITPDPSEKEEKRIENIKGSFSCEICSNVFTWKNDRDAHRKGHSQPHTCQICEKQFLKASHLKRHIDGVHSKVGHTCPTCGRVCSQKGHLKEHMKTHEPRLDIYACYVCGKKSSCKSNHDRHMKIHDTKRDMYKCYQCEKQFTTPKILKNHIACAHDNGGHLCTTCGKMCNSKGSLNIHMKTHENQRDMYKCQRCKKQFTTPSILKNHIASVHYKIRHVCTTCDKMYISKAGLDRHMKLHGPDRDLYTCHVCEKLFTTTTILKNHIDSVHNKEGHMCTTCGKIYSSKRNLRRHMTKHVTKRDTYMCHLCGKCWVEKRSMEHHIRTQHNNQHFCTECKQYFNSLAKFKKHKAVHTGENLIDTFVTDLY